MNEYLEVFIIFLCALVISIAVSMMFQTLANAKTFVAKKETIKVLVIDTGTDLSNDEIKSHVKESSNLNYEDTHGHGTAMASIVLKDTCDEIELISCKYYLTNYNTRIDASRNCFKRGLKENIQYINYSSYGASPDKEEKKILKKLSKKGVIIVVAAGNDGIDLMKSGKCEHSYPACYLFKNLYVVQNIDKNGILHFTSNYLKHKNARSEMGVNVNVLMPKKGFGKMTGTSPAAAKFTNSLLLKRCYQLHK